MYENSEPGPIVVSLSPFLTQDRSGGHGTPKGLSHFYYYIWLITKLCIVCGLRLGSGTLFGLLQKLVGVRRRVPWDVVEFVFDRIVPSF